MVGRGITSTTVQQKTKTQHEHNILSEKAAKKIHEAGNCDLHKTIFKQFIAYAYMISKKITVSVHALTQLETTIRGQQALRIKNPHKGIIKNQQKSMPRETEKMGGKQTRGTSPGLRDQERTLTEVRGYSLEMVME